ncbi:MAG: transcription antitermination factor NusB [Clostridia bacterium]|nr:transcription antitermination factor NusB [Clostridia bacterium]
MSRHEDRETVFTLLYEYTFYEKTDPMAIAALREDGEEALSEFVKDLFVGAVENLAPIDEMIAKYSVGWKVSRMSRVTRSVLRLAVYELLYTDTPPKAVINEAVEIAKKYDDSKAPGFINGILNNTARGEGKISDGDK